MAESQNHSNVLKKGRRIALLATAITIVLAGLKFVVGFLFDSKILIADAFHSASDILTIFASWFGLWLASRRKTERFPYGLYRAETIVSLVIGFLITAAGLGTLREGYERLFGLLSLHKLPVLPAAASAFSAISGYLLAFQEKRIGKEINSQSLLANAADSKLNAVSSLVVLTGIILTYLRIPYVEGGVILFISVFILKLGLSTIRVSILTLLDANLEPEVQHAIAREIFEIKGIREVTDLKIRLSGPFKMVDCSIATSPSLSVYKAHELADAVERVIKSKHAHIDSVFVHVEPTAKTVLSAIIPVKEMNGVTSRVHGHFGRAPYFVIVRFSAKGDMLEIEDFFYNEFLSETSKLHVGVRAVKALLRYNFDLLFTSHIGEISFSMLHDHFVEIFKINEDITVAEVVDLYRNDQLEQITKPTHSIDDAEVTLKTERLNQP